VVTAPAEIDITTAAELRAILAEWHSRGHVTVVMDMTGTEFCDSAGLRELVWAHKRAAADGGGLRLVMRAEGAFLRIFTLTGLDGIIPRFATAAQALSQGPAAAIRPRHRGLAPESAPIAADSLHVAATCTAEHCCEHESTHGPTLDGPGGHGPP